MLNTVLPNDRTKPLHYAPITLCEGEQGSGKSCVAVSEVVDITYSNATSIKLAGGQEFKVSPVLNEGGFPVIGQVKVHLPTKDLVVKCPVGSCVIAGDIRIYANFHFYGIRASFLTMSEILEGLNNGTISYGYLILDEHYMGGNAREAMNPVVKAITKLSNQMRKRHIYLTYISPFARQLDWIERASVRRHILCQSYNEDTHMVTYTIRQSGQRGTRTKSFYAKTYFPYYWTDELFGMSEQQIGSAIAAAR
jgi:hypothetical protein